MDLNPQTASLIDAFKKKKIDAEIRDGIKVNPLISEVATWYEKVRNAMDYKEEEVVLRGAIERIMRRRLIFGGSGKILAGPLIRELIWARYFPNETVPESIIENVSLTIDMHLKLRLALRHTNNLKESTVNTWIYQLMSSEVAYILNPVEKREIYTNFIYHLLKKNIKIEGVGEETQDAQIFIAVRRAFAKDDLAFLRYQLFNQFFGKLSEAKIKTVSANFAKGVEEIEHELSHPLGFKVFAYVKKQMPPFLILEDILLEDNQEIQEIFKDRERLKGKVLANCKRRYSSIKLKVRRAIFRSVIFILLSKAVIALTLEGSSERLFYGGINWSHLVVNIVLAPIIMIIASLFIKTDEQENSLKILRKVEALIFEGDLQFAREAVFVMEDKSTRSFRDIYFPILWFAAIAGSFGLIVFILSKLNFTIVSQGVFLFFISIVTFLTYRIYQTAHTLTVDAKQSFTAPAVDFLFLPVAQVGRYLTEGVAQFNILIYILDFIIEAPTKSFLGFFEQWFVFLHAKRDYLE